MRRLGLVVSVSMALVDAAVAGELQVISMTEDGVLAMDPNQKVYEHPGHVRTKADLILAEPEPYYGRMIERVEIAEEWECKEGKRKMTRRNFYTGNGRYVRTEPVKQPWSKVLPTSDHAPLIAVVCNGSPLEKVERFPDVEALMRAYRERLLRGQVDKPSSHLVREARGAGASD